MFLSIIIPTANRNEMLGECLAKLQPSIQGLFFNDYEIIVSDDGKENQAKAFIAQNYNNVIWVEGPKKGPAANRNNGASYAKGEWLLFTDDDCLPDNNWIKAYKEAINANEDCKVFEGYTNADRPRYRFDEEAPINTTGNNLWSCNFAIQKKLFEELNGFDVTFPYAAMEDIDFHTRVAQKTKIQFLPAAIIIHPWRRIKAFKNLNKHLSSHKHFAKKYKLAGTWQFRWSRFKIFVGSIIPEFKQLLKFSMKGTGVFLEKMTLNFMMIFN